MSLIELSWTAKIYVIIFSDRPVGTNSQLFVYDYDDDDDDDYDDGDDYDGDDDDIIMMIKTLNWFSTLAPSSCLTIRLIDRSSTSR